MMIWQSRIQILIYILLVITMQSCVDVSHNLNEVGEDKFEALEVDIVPDKLALNDTTYVPIYSDIYSKTKDTRFNLTATLSLRNTSFKHSIYISSIDYYNSAGEKTESFLEKAILLKPMQSVEYVIEEDDTSGGTGANFIIIWGSEGDKVEPIFEGVMISTHGQQGISFSTKGTSLSNK